MQTAPAKFESASPAWQHPFDVPQPRENFLGIAGFVVAIVGLVFTCGLLSPLGLLLSLAGLFSRPRGYAVAGVITGMFGSLWIVLLVGAFWLSSTVTIAAKPAIEELVRHVGETATNVNSIAEAKQKIEAFHSEHQRWPDGVEGNKLIADCKDANGNSLRYETRENGYTIRSAGSDGEFDTDDDLTDAQVDGYLKAMEEARKQAEGVSDSPPSSPTPPAAPEIPLPNSHH